MILRLRGFDYGPRPIRQALSHPRLERGGGLISDGADILSVADTTVLELEI